MPLTEKGKEYGKWSLFMKKRINIEASLVELIYAAAL